MPIVDITYVTKNNFKDEVLASTVPVLIDFWAPWCMPCKMLAPIIDEIAKETGESVKVCKVNVDDEIELATQFDVMNIPTLVVVKDGKTVSSSVGVVSKDEILEMVRV